jgi:hypothetical protein
MVDPLKTTSSQFTLWRPLRLRFRYIPSTATTSDQQICLAWMPVVCIGVSDCDTATKVEALETSVTFPAWQEADLDVTAVMLKDRLMTLHNPAVSTVNAIDGCLTCPGLLIGALAANAGGSPATLGRVLCEYTIEVYHKQPAPAGGPAEFDTSEIAVTCVEQKSREDISSEPQHVTHDTTGPMLGVGEPVALQRQSGPCPSDVDRLVPKGVPIATSGWFSR